MSIKGKSGTWKRKAFWAASRVVRRAGNMPVEIVNEHYVGSGGSVSPDGTVSDTLDDNDVAYEALYYHLMEVLSGICGS